MLKLLPLILAMTAASAAEGPYNVHFLAGGPALEKPISGGTPSWTLQGWVLPDEIADGRVALAGDLALDHGHPSLGALKASASLKPGQWVWLAASSDGTTERLWLDGKQIAQGKAHETLGPTLVLGGREAGAEGFGGKLAGLMVEQGDLSPDRAKALAAQKPDADLTVFEEATPVWAVQIKQMVGMTAPQPAWTLPKSKAPFSQPVAKPAIATPGLGASGPNRWTLGDFRLQAEPKVTGDGAALSKPGYDAGSWYIATVPGTVLTTLVDRGVYPDPDYGLNNMAIPESLARQNYWYRSEFDVPADLAGRKLLLNFEGINYAAEIWLNGQRLGDVKGAFIRGRFDVTGALRPGQRNALAVRISPPPHPGIPHEQSILAGAGENGGMEALDGPTFIATEGWDWMPGVRDRNSGLWRGVTLEASGIVRLGDVQVTTSLPLPDLSRAEIKISVPVENLSAQPVTTTIAASFDGLSASKEVTLPPGASEVALAPVTVKNPALWWPNGMGEPALHKMHITAGESDAKDVRFGIREITYELSLMDPAGHLRRVEIDPAKSPGIALVDGSHEGIRKSTSGWVQSLTPAGAVSPAVKKLSDTSLAPYLVIRVNGVRVPARGGSWGTDDYRKRVTRQKLEPFFRL
ncbi:MAG TPA: LamG-like jellyroll fold domain-containing protein, partial [Magnetospirillaceae bacterium]|nr:LamG-like jellyroll fold domain-containing protein [Magnetospirillaceae bacterium]